MKIVKKYLSPNPYSRCQRKLQNQLAIVMHWTANPKASADDNRKYFERRADGLNGYGSAHYIIGQDGYTIQCMPETEVAYHCGTTIKDPASGKVYTDLARERFGEYAIDYKHQSPNNCTIAIELCPTDDAGHFTFDTLEAAAVLCTQIIRRYNLTPADILTHHDIVGWKDCPRLWVNEPELLDEFRAAVEGLL